MKAEHSVLVSYVEIDTNSICYQELSPLARFAGTDYISDIEQGYEIELSREEFDQLAELQAAQFLGEGQAITSLRLRRVPNDYRMRNSPAGGELFHMIYREKGLSAFSMGLQDDEFLMLSEQNFEKYIDCGRIEKRAFTIECEGNLIKYVIFYLLTQSWRADVYENLKRHLAVSSWTDYLNRIEAIALDYRDSKN